jgi:signal transduction histidine kinase
MTADQLVQHLSNATFLFIFGVIAVESLRRPAETTLYALAFFGIVALVVVLGAVTQVTGTTAPGALTRVSAALIMALPLLLLVMANAFLPVPRVVLWVAGGGLAAAVLTVATFAPPYANLVTLALIGYFVAVTVYATWRFAAGSRQASGVTRRRMQMVAAGSGFLALALGVGAFSLQFPGLQPVWTALSRLAGVACAASYFLGFAPPRTLRRAWRDAALRDFLSVIDALRYDSALADAALALNPAIARAVGATHALVVVWDEATQRLAAPGVAMEMPEGRSGTTVAADVFRTQRARFVRNAPKADPLNADVYRQYNAIALLLAPVTDGERRFGVLSAYAERDAVFALEDVSLLEVLANEVAQYLHRRELMESAAALRAQQEVTQLKEEFLSAAAHDLRTPLTIMLGQAQLLQRRLRARPEAPVDPESLDRIVNEARRMRQLTEDLLDISHAEEGTGFLGELAPTDLFALATEVAASVQSAYHRVRVEGAHVHAVVDRNRMLQVVANLVENAVKFSPGGGEVVVATTEEAAGAHLVVSDQGIGIPQGDLEQIFLRFRRGSGEEMRRYAGTGVGLYLCRRIVEEHGGRIWAESRGRGSQLHVLLPRRAHADEGE